MKRPLQPRDLKLRDWIAQYSAAHEDVSPTHAEMAEGMGWGRRVVEESLKRLDAHGKIHRMWHGPRSVRAVRVEERPGAMERIRRLELRAAHLEQRLEEACLRVTILEARMGVSDAAE